MSVSLVSSDPRLAGVCWRTSTRTNGGGACVQIAGGPGTVLIRDSKDRSPDSPVLAVTTTAWHTFLATAPSSPA